MCNSEEVETIHHALLQCSFAKSCWGKFDNEEADHSDDLFGEWLMKTFDGWDTKKRQLGAMLCWSIWKARNEMVWKQKGMEVNEVVMSANVVLNQWYSAQDKSFDHFLGLMTQEDGDERWVAPKEDKVKVNTDAALFYPYNCYSRAFVVRNHAGNLVEAQSRCCPGSCTPEIAEALGINETLSWLKEHDHSDAVVETDCLVAIQAIKGPSILLSYFGRIIEDCKALVEDLKGRNVSIKFIKRFANHVTHYIARYSSSIADRISTMSNAHPELINVLMNDLK